MYLSALDNVSVVVGGALQLENSTVTRGSRASVLIGASRLIGTTLDGCSRCGERYQGENDD
jgi:hypothetical protein